MASSSAAPTSLLYACIAHGTTILAEHTSPGTSSTSASSLASVILPKISHSSPQKLTYTHDRLFVHYIADSPSSSSNAPDEELSSHAALTYLAVAQSELGRRIPFAFLLELKKKFLAQYPPESTNFQSLPPYGSAAFNTTLKSMLGTYNISPPSDSLSNARKEIDSVKNIMTENIERVLERGERIDLLVDKTDRLGGSARDFRVRSRGLRRQMWWKNVRIMVLLVVVVIFLIYLFVGFGCGLPAWGRCIGRG
jgi:vesicle-associated membrane protein 7